MRNIQVRVSALVAQDSNANVMTEARFRGLLESIKRFGFIVPILVQALEGEEQFLIVDGHHRVRAATELELELVPAVLLEAGDDPRVVALAVNRLRGETDLAVASMIISDLVEGGLQPIDLQVTGFSMREIDELLKATVSPDDVSLDDMADTGVPEEVGSPVARPFLLDLTFRSKEDLAQCRKALRKAAGKGGDLADGLLRLVRGEA